MRKYALALLGLGVLTFFAIGCGEKAEGSDTDSDDGAKTGASSSTPPPAGDTAGTPSAGVDFVASVQPTFTKYCIKCHSGPEAKDGVDLTKITSNADLVAMKDRVMKLIAVVESKKMPPAKEANQPTDEERAKLVADLKEIIK